MIEYVGIYIKTEKSTGRDGAANTTELVPATPRLAAR